MRRIFTILFAGLMVSAQVWAVSAKDVCGQFDGDLNIAGSAYPNKTVYLLPGTVDNTVTFVLPDFKYNAGKLGNIVLPNIPMDEKGMLTLENSTLYLDSISERATITILNGIEDGGIVYNSIISETDAQVILSIGAPSLPEAILVLFQGKAATNKNYAIVNGGFEDSISIDNGTLEIGERFWSDNVLDVTEKDGKFAIRMVYEITERTTSAGGQEMLFPETEIDMYWTSLGPVQPLRMTQPITITSLILPMMDLILPSRVVQTRSCSGQSTCLPTVTLLTRSTKRV